MMDQILCKLYEDHRHFEKLLDQLEQFPVESETVTTDQLRTVLSLVNALQHDHVREHHESEDAAVELLVAHSQISNPMIQAIMDDHVLLDAAAIEATTMVEQALNDSAIYSLSNIQNHIRSFTKSYRNHIRTEEDVLFPMIREVQAEITIQEPQPG